ncbi:MAG: hypothetical protein ACE5DK_06705 [Paracoccaceae bacterium]
MHRDKNNGQRFATAGAVISTCASIVDADVVFDFGAGATGTAALVNDIVLI